MDYMSRNLKGNFKQADRLNAKFIIIIGEEEMANDYVTIKNNITKEEYKLETAYLVNFLDEKLIEEHYHHDCECDECHCDDDCDCHNH